MGAVHEKQDLFLDVLRFPDVQFFEVEGIFGRILADLVFIQERLLITILVEFIVVVVFKGTIEFLENQVEGMLLSYEGLSFWQVSIAYDLERKLLALLQDLISLELDFLVVNLFKLKLLVILVLIKLDQWFKISIVIVLIGVQDVLCILIIDYNSRLILHLGVNELLIEALGSLP